MVIALAVAAALFFVWMLWDAHWHAPIPRPHADGPKMVRITQLSCTVCGWSAGAGSYGDRETCPHCGGRLLGMGTVETWEPKPPG